MIPLMYDYNEKFLITLTDCIKCEVEEEINGIYEATLTYPVSGKAYSQIQVGNYIKCKANDKNEPQMFFIYKISKPIMGAIDIYCKHIRYKLNDYVVPPKTVMGGYQDLMNSYLRWADSRFTAESKITGGYETIEVKIPRACSEYFMGETNSLLSRSHGEFEFDNYNIILYSQRGDVKPISVEYGKNLTGFSCESDTSSAYSHIFPYFYQEDTENPDNSVYVALDEREMEVPDSENLPFRKCMIVDLTSEFDTPPNKAELRHQAELFLRNNNVAAIDFSFQVEFIPLSKTEEYKKLSQLNTLSLGDTINIHHKPLEIDVQSRVIKLTYDGLSEKVISMNLGSFVPDYSSSVLQTLKTVQFNVDKTIDNTKKSLKNMVNDKASLITGNKGGYIVYRDTDGDGLPDEQLIMDKPSITTANNVWRWNKGGFGHSSTGYNGRYDVAITMDGSINADFIRTGSLSADRITGGYLTDTTEKFVLNLNTGEITIKTSSGSTLEIWTSGITMYDENKRILSSMFQSTENKGVLTAQSIFVGERDHETITMYDGTLSCDNIICKKIDTTIYTPYGISLKENNSERGAFYITSEHKAALKADFLIIDNKTFMPYTIDIGGQKIEVLAKPV